MSMPDTTLERMVTALLGDRRDNESAVPALQRAGFTGAEIVAGIDAAEAVVAHRTGADSRNPALLAQARTLAAAFGRPHPAIYPRLTVIGGAMCLQASADATIQPLTPTEASFLLGLEAA